MAYWKWGVHFGGMQNRSHYTFMLENRIVFGRANLTPYHIGDLVAVSNGLGLLAIARVDEAPQPITNEPRFFDLENNYGIEYVTTTIFAPATWVKVMPIQQGSVEIHETTHQETIQIIWNHLSSLIQN